MVEGKMVLKILKPPRNKDSLGSLTGQSLSWVFNVRNLYVIQVLLLKNCRVMSTNFLFSKCPAMFCLKVKVMGSNPGYLLKSFLLFLKCSILRQKQFLERQRKMTLKSVFMVLLEFKFKFSIVCTVVIR